MKNFVAMLLSVLFVGCSGQQAAQIAASLAIRLIPDAARALKPEPPEALIEVEKEIEKYQIGNCDVGFYEGTYRGQPSFLLVAESKITKEKRNLIFRKNSHAAMQRMAPFNQMDKAGKKQQIRDWYILAQDFDLGPDPEPTGEPPHDN